jgi:cytochrome c-type biogenesis protein
MLSDPISYTAALGAGLLSFFSPCILPLIPAYFTFITGYSLEELTGEQPGAVRHKVVRSTIAYVLGFSLVFILMGASASYLGSLAFKYRDIIRIGGGIIIILLGLHLIGVLRWRGLDFERRLTLQTKPMHFMGTFLVGMAFGAGWSPCIGPLLGSVLVLAGNQQTVSQGVALLCVYSAGLAIPFLVLSVFINFLLRFIRKATRALKWFNAVAGILLILMGGLLLADKLSVLNIQI